MIFPRYFKISLLFFLCYISGNSQEIRIELIGDSNTETKLLQQHLHSNSFKNFKILEEKLLQTQNQLIQQGFINIERSGFIKKNDSTYTEKWKLNTPIKNARIKHNNLLNQELLKELNHKHDTLYIYTNFESIEKLLKKINVFYTEKGYVFQEVRLSNISIKQDLLEAQLKIKQQQQRKVSAIKIKGYKNFPKPFLKYKYKIKPGIVFNKDQITKQTEKINSLGFASQIKPPEVLFTKDSTTLYLYLKKKNANTFDGFIGFTNSEGDFQLTGNANLLLKNNFNAGEELNIHYLNDGKSQTQFSASVKIPFLFNSPIGIAANLNITKQDSSFTNNTQEIKLSYQATPSLQTSIGYRAISSNNLTENILIQNQEDFNKTFATLNLNYTPTSSTSLIKEHSYIETSIGAGSNKTNNNKTQQFFIETTASHSFTLNARNSIYLKNNTAYLDSKNYLTNELYRFGGTNSLRGFTENQLYASFYTSLQTEYRYLLNPNIYIHSIIDFANFSNASDKKFNKNYYSLGFGLGLRNKQSLLKLSFANGMHDNQSFNLQNTIVHISLIIHF
ncbi:MAG: POTRA domain-containing protein [Mesonia hippocampi]|uniref:POTRA domain-containing protein n=1 Tax=Mesonia hippocampi TaxID=1628250 RepID=UPI003F947F2E